MYSLSQYWIFMKLINYDEQYWWSGSAEWTPSLHTSFFSDTEDNNTGLKTDSAERDTKQQGADHGFTRGKDVLINLPILSHRRIWPLHVTSASLNWYRVKLGLMLHVITPTTSANLQVTADLNDHHFVNLMIILDQLWQSNYQIQQSFHKANYCDSIATIKSDFSQSHAESSIYQ